MSAGSLSTVLDVDGPAAPPRSNGELVFAAPWESRAFGLALSLHAAGTFEWEDFRQSLIAVIADWERSHDDDEQWSYYRCWLIALERLVDQLGLVAGSELSARARDLADRPAGHDHDHEHGHGHGHDDAEEGHGHDHG